MATTNTRAPSAQTATEIQPYAGSLVTDKRGATVTETTYAGALEFIGASDEARKAIYRPT